MSTITCAKCGGIYFDGYNHECQTSAIDNAIPQIGVYPLIKMPKPQPDAYGMTIKCGICGRHYQEGFTHKCLPKIEEVCEWKHISTDTAYAYKTCKNLIRTSAFLPDMEFCPYCSKKIKVII